MNIHKLYVTPIFLFIFTAYASDNTSLHDPMTQLLNEGYAEQLENQQLNNEQLNVEKQAAKKGISELPFDIKNIICVYAYWQRAVYDRYKVFSSPNDDDNNIHNLVFEVEPNTKKYIFSNENDSLSYLRSHKPDTANVQKDGSVYSLQSDNGHAYKPSRFHKQHYIMHEPTNTALALDLCTSSLFGLGSSGQYIEIRSLPKDFILGITTHTEFGSIKLPQNISLDSSDDISCSIDQSYAGKRLAVWACKNKLIQILVNESTTFLWNTINNQQQSFTLPKNRFNKILHIPTLNNTLIGLNCCGQIYIIGLPRPERNETEVKLFKQNVKFTNKLADDEERIINGIAVNPEAPHMIALLTLVHKKNDIKNQKFELYTVLLTGDDGQKARMKKIGEFSDYCIGYIQKLENYKQLFGPYGSSINSTELQFRDSLITIRNEIMFHSGGCGRRIEGLGYANRFIQCPDVLAMKNRRTNNNATQTEEPINNSINRIYGWKPFGYIEERY